MANEIRNIILSNAADDPVRISIDAIMQSVRLLTLATVSPSGDPYVNTCYFAHDSNWQVYILTPPSSVHATYAQQHPSCAVNIADTNHKVGDPIAGLQLLGRVSKLERESAKQAFDTYTRKHKKFLDYAASENFVYDNFESRFYSFSIERGKLIDETNFGGENYIEFLVKR